jgi:hypothetical protein
MQTTSTQLTALKKRIRSRARNWYMLDLTVTSDGLTLTLTLRNPKTGQVAKGTTSIDAYELAEVIADGPSFSDYVDRIIERFVYPIRPLQLLD